MPDANEITRLRTELERAYRCIYGFYNAHTEGKPLASIAYHSLTIGAASRFVREGSLEGSEYFVGKPVDVLHAALGPRPTSDAGATR